METPSLSDDARIGRLEMRHGESPSSDTVSLESEGWRRDEKKKKKKKQRQEEDRRKENNKAREDDAMTSD